VTSPDIFKGKFLAVKKEGKKNLNNITNGWIQVEKLKNDLDAG
jgi:hypothetical protein